ncbi:MAG: tRNA uridine-5-carboxymethylaminomethyl(34) synthesis GTPase MnmE [Candidatus Omnitrophica bacterium]|nr:tRNA uridine-5-carboxymethylaminomethyl(34) synthesis GTPase MnmE [Candidatus Omnitrophota bacterium]
MTLKELPGDTIAAISTPPGEGGLGVIRLSGPQALAIADKVFKPKSKILPSQQKTFTAQLGQLVDPSASSLRSVARDDRGTGLIDEVIALVMRSPKSYTCEDVVELSAHGGSAVLQAIMEALLKEGARLAAPGEFTKRAFLNGRIDLLQAEAVLDLIQARTQAARRFAGAAIDGHLSRKIAGVKENLIRILSHLEAAIDFPDEHLSPTPPDQMARELEKITQTIHQLLQSSDLGLLAKRGLKVVLAGKPNAGKSSLLNQLAKKNRVIVTPYPGTTRDVVEEEIQLSGFPVRLVDTAGIQETEHPIEREGVARSRQAIAQADLVLFVTDASRGWEAQDEAVLRELDGRPRLIILNKSDLPLALDLKGLVARAGEPLLRTSCVEAEGVRPLERAIEAFILNGRAEIPQEAVVTTVRQRDLLDRAAKGLEAARVACLGGFSAEFVASDVRMAMESLGELAGEMVTDDVLDALFNQFCIGK